jgi:hypothetical protein
MERNLPPPPTPSRPNWPPHQLSFLMIIAIERKRTCPNNNLPPPPNFIFSQGLPDGHCMQV